jgi:hypothetical protein
MFSFGLQRKNILYVIYKYISQLSNPASNDRVPESVLLILAAANSQSGAVADITNWKDFQCLAVPTT